jgi:hypothetical protein
MAAGDILIAEGTSVTFQETGGDHLCTLSSLADGTGRQSAGYDGGAAPRTNLYRLECKFQAAATPTVGQAVDVYLKTSNDGTNWDNDDAAGDGALSSTDKLLNLTHVTSVIVDQAAADIPLQKTVTFSTNARHLAFVVVNNSGAALTATATEHVLTMTPLTYQGQTA